MKKLTCRFHIKITEEDRKKINDLAKKYETTASKITRYAIRFIHEESKKSESSKKIFEFINSNL